MNLNLPTVDVQQLNPAQKKFFLIANPKAGSMNVDRFKEDLARIFAQNDHEYEVHFTRPDEAIASIVSKAVKDGWDVVVAVGGDGTVSMVADGLRNIDIPLGILPMGTGNVFAQELGIPLKLDQAISLMVGDHRCRPVDSMEIGGRLYLLYAGAGITSVMMDGASSESKRHYKILAYIWSGLKKLSGWQPFRFKLEIDGTSLSSSAIEVGVANARTAGGKPFNWGEEVSVDDRRLMVCIVRSKTWLDYIQTFFDLLLGRTHQSKHIQRYPAYHHIKIDAAAAVSVEADGEVVGNTPVEITVVPHAVSVIVPMENELSN